MFPFVKHVSKVVRFIQAVEWQLPAAGVGRVNRVLLFNRNKVPEMQGVLQIRHATLCLQLMILCSVLKFKQLALVVSVLTTVK